VTAWRKEQTRDRFFRQAKQDKYRARSAYKLLEIVKRTRLIRRGDLVLDLGAAPGSWSQVALDLVGPTGQVVAVDLSAIQPLAGLTTFQADILDPSLLEQLRATVPHPFDVVLSDVSP
jgi:23S rRNA (uridine2552-2'-O)-methyltransferase